MSVRGTARAAWPRPRGHVPSTRVPSAWGIEAQARCRSALGSNAEKSLVNELAEMLGAAPPDDELDMLDVAVPPADDELDDDELDELPQAATPSVAVTARAATSGLRLRKCT